MPREPIRTEPGYRKPVDYATAQDVVDSEDSLEAWTILSNRRQWGIQLTLSASDSDAHPSRLTMDALDGRIVDDLFDDEAEAMMRALDVTMVYLYHESLKKNARRRGCCP